MEGKVFEDVIREYSTSYNKLSEWKQNAIKAIFNAQPGCIVYIHERKEMLGEKPDSKLSMRAVKRGGYTSIIKESRGGYRIGVTRETYLERKVAAGGNDFFEKSIGNQRIDRTLSVNTHQWVKDKAGNVISKKPDKFYLCYDEPYGVYSRTYTDQNGDQIENIKDLYTESALKPKENDYGFRNMSWDNIAGIKIGNVIYGEY